MMSQKIRVILADDHDVVLQGLTATLSKAEDIEICGTATNGKDLIALLSHTTCDLVILDITMPGMDGMEILVHLRKHFPEIEVLILTAHKEQEFIHEFFQAGVKGYIVKNTGVETILDGIRAVHRGERFFPGEVGQTIIEIIRSVEGPPQLQNESQFTNREMEILRLLAAGKTSRQIASHTHLSVNTVQTYRSRLLQKAGASNTIELVRYCLKAGLLDRTST